MAVVHVAGSQQAFGFSVEHHTNGLRRAAHAHRKLHPAPRLLLHPVLQALSSRDDRLCTAIAAELRLEVKAGRVTMSHRVRSLRCALPM